MSIGRRRRPRMRAAAWHIRGRELFAAGLLTMGGMVGAVATAGPEDQPPLRLRQEARGITEAIRRSEHRDSINVTELHATTMTTLRRALLDADYDLVHLSGHGDVDGPLLEDDDANAVVLTIDVLADLIKVSSTIRCVVLNCCYAAGSLTEALAQWTVGMDDQVGDDVAIQFAVGFFDALGAGKDIDRCIEEGRIAARMATGGEEPSIVVLIDNPAADMDGSHPSE